MIKKAFFYFKYIIFHKIVCFSHLLMLPFCSSGYTSNTCFGCRFMWETSWNGIFFWAFALILPATDSVNLYFRQNNWDQNDPSKGKDHLGKFSIGRPMATSHFLRSSFLSLPGIWWNVTFFFRPFLFASGFLTHRCTHRRNSAACRIFYLTIWDILSYNMWLSMAKQGKRWTHRHACNDTAR